MQAHVVDDERASLTTLHVLGFVEALGGEGSEGSETLSAVRPAKPMRIVLDQADPVAFGDAVEGVHVAADARVVHHDDRLAPSRDGGFDKPLVEVEGVRAAVDEHCCRATQAEGAGRGAERERRHDHFVAGPDVKQHRRHVQCVGT